MTFFVIRLLESQNNREVVDISISSNSTLSSNNTSTPKDQMPTDVLVLLTVCTKAMTLGVVSSSSDINICWSQMLSRAVGNGVVMVKSSFDESF